jgi:small-conductance mechanosensitive channel
MSLLIMILNVAITIAVFGLIGEFLIRVITRAAKVAGFSRGQVHLIKEWIGLLSLVLAVGAVVQIIGLASEFATLTISGIIALALSLALQTTLSNIISGILVLLDKTLRVHDRIEFGGISGEVVKLGLRSTWIKTSEGKLAIVSNNSIVNGPLINLTAVERLEKKLQY